MRKIIKRYLRRSIKRTFRKIIINRKIISFFLAFTISFSLVSNYKKEEPKAEIITLTTGTIIACAALATAMGVVITNPDMLEDVGTRVYEGIKNIPNAISNVGNMIKVNANKQVFDAVLDVAKVIPIKDYILEKFTSSLTNKSNVTSVGWGTDDIRYGSFTFIYNGTYSYLSSVYFNTYGESNYIGSISVTKGVEHTLSYKLLEKDWHVYFDGNEIWKSENFNIPKHTYGSFSWKHSVTLVSKECSTSVTIPYTEENTKSVSADLPQTYFPNLSGSISVPIDKPLSDYSPSVSSPLSVPNDFVLEDAGVVIESDTVTDDTVTDDTVTDDTVIDNVSDSILNPTFDKTLDFSPLYIDLSKKFPFSIPWDFYNLFKDFEVSKKRPVVSYIFPEKYFNSYELTVDLAFYDDVFPFTTILRYFLLIAFVYFLIIKTRNLIGG